MTEDVRAGAAMRVLVIDDEKNIRSTLGVCLEGMGCTFTGAANSEMALQALEREPFDLAFLDLRLGEEDGIELLPKLLAQRTELAVVVITAHATFDTAVEAIKRGASDYLPKPFTPVQIRHVVEQVASRRAMERRLADLEANLADQVPEVDLSSNSPTMRAVMDLLQRAADSEAPILLRGENGTGKGVLARAIHAQSRRAGRRFVTVNCPTLSAELLASELFGHTKGAFTGAVRDQPGRVEMAEGGTLFLDEIGEITSTLQAKLLRFLQEKQFERIGENLTRRADVRIVAATNRDLEKDVEEGRFRQDLLFRLNVIEVRVPALRERPEDILNLARRFLQFFARAAGRPGAELSKEAESALLEHTWPGNVRELRNAMERAVILWPGTRTLGPDTLPGRIAEHAVSLPRLGGDFTIADVEREHIIRVLQRTSTLDDAAHILGIDSSTLWRKRKKLEKLRGPLRLIDLVSPRGILVPFHATDASDAILRLSPHLAEATGLSNDRIAGALLAREALGSTALGSGLAVPHERMDIEHTIAVIGVAPEGIGFDTPDGEPVRIVVALLSSEREGGHLAALSAVSRALGGADMREKLLSATTSAEVLALLREN